MHPSAIVFPPCTAIQGLGIRAAESLNDENSNANLWEKPNGKVANTRLFRPRKKKGWQWSKGDAPGEYGGPPIGGKLRKYWGDVSDPITSRDDFIWNKRWRSHVEVFQVEPTRVESTSQEQGTGFLSLNRAMALDSIEVDLSGELMKPSKSILEQQVEAARLGLPADETIKSDKPRWRMAPTQRERQQWDRARKAATGGTVCQHLPF